MSGDEKSTLSIFRGTLCVLILAAVVAVTGCSAAPPGGAATTSDTASPAKKVVLTHHKKQVKKRIPFARKVIETSTLDEGESVLQQRGRPGLRVRVMRLTVRNGHLIGSHLLRSYISRAPVAQVRLVGTRVKPKPRPASSGCDSNYSGGCVPVASDVDCGGGSGDGPAYFNGVATVVGSDIYDLDRDGDGRACDS